jgi:hypothetical protein
MQPKDARIGTPDHSVLHEAVLAQGSRPNERRRGSWSFLTWSFFLAQTIAAEKFFGSGARAAENDDAGATRSNGQSQTPPDGTAAAAAWGPGGQEAGDGRTIDPQTSLDGAQGLPLPGVSQAASDYSGTGSAGSPNGGGSDSSGGGSSSASGPSQADSQASGDSSTISPASEDPASASDDIIPPPGVIDAGIDIGPEGTDLDLELNLDPVAETGLGLELGLGDGADLGLDLGLGSPLGDALALETEVNLDVNLLGGDPSLDLGIGVGATSPLLNASIDQVTQAPGEFVTSVVSNTTTGLESLQQVGAVSSGDAIAFSGGATSNLADDLFTGGRYTDYSLELHTGGSPSVGNVTNSLDSDIVDEGPSSLLDSSDTEGASTQSRSSVEDNLDTSHLGVPNSVDELARTDSL